MKKITKYYKWIDKNIFNIDDTKTILVIGATGSIGSYLSTFLSYKKANLILAGRNLKVLNELKDNLNKEFNNQIEILIIDFANLESVNDAIQTIKDKYKIDTIIDNAGIYHQPLKEIYGHDQTYVINYLMPVYFYEHLKDYLKENHTKVVNVASVSYRYHKLDLNDFEGLKKRTKTGRYSVSKRNLMYYTNYLKSLDNIPCTLTHPGVSTTNLFAKKNNAYPKIFYLTCVPIMKLIFMPPIKASLSLLKAIDSNNIPLDKWVGPRGLLHSWGYPNIQKIHGDLMDQKTLKIVYERTMKDMKDLK